MRVCGARGASCRLVKLGDACVHEVKLAGGGGARVPVVMGADTEKSGCARYAVRERYRGRQFRRAVLLAFICAALVVLVWLSHGCGVACARSRVARICSLPARFSTDRYGEGAQWRVVTDAAAAALGWVVERVGDGPGGAAAGCARALSASDARAILAGQHVLFFGDSISRQHFMSFAYFFDHGSWVAPLNATATHLADALRGKKVRELDTWRAWHQLERTVMPTLIDEVDPEGVPPAERYTTNHRYWWSRDCDPGTRASFVFWSWHENVTLHSPRSLGVDECIGAPFARARAGARSACAHRAACAANFAARAPQLERVSFPEPDDGLAYVLDALAPDVVVLNSGLHGGPRNDNGAHRAVVRRIAAVLRDAAARLAAERPPRNLRIVWRTTTRGRNPPPDWWPPSKQVGVAADFETLCGAEVLDAWSLTEGLMQGDKGLMQGAYYDSTHSSPSVASEVNAALIALLARDPPVRRRMHG